MKSWHLAVNSILLTMGPKLYLVIPGLHLSASICQYLPASTSYGSVAGIVFCCVDTKLKELISFKLYWGMENHEHVITIDDTCVIMCYSLRAQQATLSASWSLMT